MLFAEVFHSSFPWNFYHPKKKESPSKHDFSEVKVAVKLGGVQSSDAWDMLEWAKLSLSWSDHQSKCSLAISPHEQWSKSCQFYTRIDTRWVRWFQRFVLILNPKIEFHDPTCWVLFSYQVVAKSPTPAECLQEVMPLSRLGILDKLIRIQSLINQFTGTSQNLVKCIAKESQYITFTTDVITVFSYA